MKEKFDLYAINASCLEDARTRVENILGLSLTEHESGYHGGVYYRHGNSGEEHFILKTNYDAMDDEWFEPEHESAEFIFYANQTQRSDEIRAIIEGRRIGILLRSEEL